MRPVPTRFRSSVRTLEEPAVATAVLHPMRNRLLAALTEPASAAGLAEQLGLPRQKVNYHLRELERLGLAHVVEERRWGGITERLYLATASAYVVSAKAMGGVGADPRRIGDRLSAGYLIALGQRLADEVGALGVQAEVSQKQLATLSLDTAIWFGSAAKRAAFTEELTGMVRALVARYHEPAVPGSRAHRLVVGAHPIAPDALEQEAACR